MNKIRYGFLILFTLLVVCGCDYTGSLSTKENNKVMNYLVDNKYIDESCNLETDGIGEGELFEYYCDVKVNNENRLLKIKQYSHNEKYRVFTATIYDMETNDELQTCYLKINKENSKVSNYKN